MTPLKIKYEGVKLKVLSAISLPMKKKELYFILFVGLFYGLLIASNFYLLNKIGYYVMILSAIEVLLTMFFIMRLYKKYFNVELQFLKSILIGLPIFFIGAIMTFIAEDLFSIGEVTYSYYANGYFLNSLEEILKQTIPISIIFTLVFAPIYRLIKRKITAPIIEGLSS